MKNQFSLKPISLLLLSFLIAMNCGFSQDFGDIDSKRLIEETHPNDAEASHAYMVKNSYVYYDQNSQELRIVSQYHNQIKIYKEEGIEEANVVVYLSRNKGDRETVKKIKAVCYNYVNGKVEKTELSKKAIYKEELDEYRTKVSFAIPNVRVGSIIEYSYRVSSPFVYSFPRHFFQTAVPVDYSRMKVDVPDYFTMAPTATGMVALNRQQKLKTSFGQNVTQFTFEATDVPGIADDKYVLNSNDYRSSLKYELSEVAFPGRAVQKFTQGWNSICKNLSNHRGFGKFLKKKVKQADEFMEGLAGMTDSEKLYAIVDFLNSNIVWNGEIGEYASTSPKKIFEAKTGNVGDINLLLINLCRRAGLETDPVLTKYRFYGVLNTSYPSATEINYVFARVEIDGKEIFVDATSSYHEPGHLPLRALNIEGVLMLGDIGEVIMLKNTNQNYLRKAGKYTLNLEENKLEGLGKTILKGYAAVQTRKEYNEDDDDEDLQNLIKEIDEDDENDDVNDVDGDDDDEDEEDLEDEFVYTEADGIDDKYGTISSAFSASLYSPLEMIGDEIFIDAFVTLAFEENPFLDEVRRYPAFFNSKHHFNHVSIIEIPEGYSLKSKPDNLTIKIVNDKGWMKYSINESSNNLTVNVLFKLDDDIFMPEEYASLYAFLDKVLELQREKIVLVKN